MDIGWPGKLVCTAYHMCMSQIRVLRLIEYIYETPEVMASDMSNWRVQGTHRPNNRVLIKSTILPLEVLGTPPRYNTKDENIAFRKAWDAQVAAGQAIVEVD